MVPSFGVWGFVMAGGAGAEPGLRTDVPRQFLEPEALPAMFYFPPDLREPTDLNLQPNRLDRPVLLDYFLDEWSDWQREKTS